MASPYNLEERTALFGEKCIVLCKSLPQTLVVRPLVLQLVRSATSVGANYMEANGASSKKDFKNKIHICKKEAQETKHWLRMLKTAEQSKEKELAILWQEAQELALIFNKITHTMKEN